MPARVPICIQNSVNKLFWVTDNPFSSEGHYTLISSTTTILQFGWPCREQKNPLSASNGQTKPSKHRVRPQGEGQGVEQWIKQTPQEKMQSGYSHWIFTGCGAVYSTSAVLPITAPSLTYSPLLTRPWLKGKQSHKRVQRETNRSQWKQRELANWAPAGKQSTPTVWSDSAESSGVLGRSPFFCKPGLFP